MALLLSLETSSHSFSCALHAEGQLISSQEIEIKQSTASLLAVKIEELFKNTSFKKNEIQAVSISSGPGSYTGLRIGTSTAKGICYALNVKLIAVNTLALLAYQFMKTKNAKWPNHFFLCPMLDARRAEVYCEVFNEQGHSVEKTNAKVIDENSFLDYLNQSPVFFFGEGANKCKALIHHPQAIFVDDINPSAVYLGEMSWEKFNTHQFESMEQFEPFYLKDFVFKKPITTS